MKYTHYKCMSCKTIAPVQERVNIPWMGWAPNGDAIHVPNYCCGSCGSNDLVLRKNEEATK